MYYFSKTCSNIFCMLTSELHFYFIISILLCLCTLFYELAWIINGHYIFSIHLCCIGLFISSVWMDGSKNRTSFWTPSALTISKCLFISFFFAYPKQPSAPFIVWGCFKSPSPSHITFTWAGYITSPRSIHSFLLMNPNSHSLDKLYRSLRCSLVG